jgi:hypothetical protein
MYNGDQPKFCAIYIASLNEEAKKSIDGKNVKANVDAFEAYMNYLKYSGLGTQVYNILETVFRSISIYIFYLQLFEWIVQIHLIVSQLGRSVD